MRTPQIGDAVRRSHAGGVFEGFIIGVYGAEARVATERACWMLGARETVQEDEARNVPLVCLIRGFDNWRWQPFDGEPRAGDMIISDTGRRVVLSEREEDGWGAVDPETGTRIHYGVPYRYLTMAIAGIDGWRWEPRCVGDPPLDSEKAAK